MTENKNTEDKKKNIDWNKTKKVLQKSFDWIWKNLKKAWAFLKRQKILKIIAFILVTLSGFFIFLESLILSLIFLDKEKFAEIVRYFFDFNLFDYVAVSNFYSILSGGYMIDMFFWLVILLLALIWWNGKNYFKKAKVRVALLSLIALGIIIFSFSFYKAMPQIMIPVSKIVNFYEKDDDYKNKWYIEREKYKNGFGERGYLNDENIKGYYNYINLGW